METFWIRNARIITMDDQFRILDGDLLVQDGVISVIVAIGTECDKKRPGDPTVAAVDFNGDYLIPGLIQSHIHLCQTLFRHHAEGLPLLRWLRERIWPFEAALDEKAIQVSARLGIGELLLCGTTCLLDMGTVRHEDALAEIVVQSGIRAAIGKAMMDRGEGLPDGLLETTRHSLDESLKLARRWHGYDGDRIRYAFAPRFILSCTPELQREVARLADENGYLIHTHCGEHPEEVQSIQELTGKRTAVLLEELGLCGPSSIFAHGVHLDERERSLLADSETSLCHCPSANLKLGSGVADTVELLSGGINVGIGADGASCNNSLDIFVEMRLAHLLQGAKRGPGERSARRVLGMATQNGARALNWQQKIGSIEVGKEADLVRLRRRDFRSGFGDPYSEIVSAGTRDLVKDVWVRGRMLVRDGRLLGDDPVKLFEEGEAALAGILQELN